jgi:hypothetical protein
MAKSPVNDFFKKNLLHLESDFENMLQEVVKVKK